MEISVTKDGSTGEKFANLNNFIQHESLHKEMKTSRSGCAYIFFYNAKFD